MFFATVKQLIVFLWQLEASIDLKYPVLASLPEVRLPNVSLAVEAIIYGSNRGHPDITAKVRL